MAIMRWAAPVSSGVAVKPIPVIPVVIIASTVVIPIAIAFVIMLVFVIAPAIASSLCKYISTDHQHTGNHQGTQEFHVRFHNTNS
jgi:hypothetical protein